MNFLTKLSGFTDRIRDVAFNGITWVDTATKSTSRFARKLCPLPLNFSSFSVFVCTLLRIITWTTCFYVDHSILMLNNLSGQSFCSRFLDRVWLMCYCSQHQFVLWIFVPIPSDALKLVKVDSCTVQTTRPFSTQQGHNTYTEHYLICRQPEARPPPFKDPPF